MFLPLLLMVTAFGAGIWHLQQQGIRRRVVSWGRCAAFALGILALIAALMSPLDLLAEVLFSAHMTQHLMLMLVTPLLILGRMDIVLLWTFPMPARRLIGQGWRKATWLRSAFNLLSRPVTVWLLASSVMWFWHISGPYAWAFYNLDIHILEHLSFFLTSLAFWALVMQPFRREKSGHGTAPWCCLPRLPWKVRCWAHCSRLPGIRYMLHTRPKYRGTCRIFCLTFRRCRISSLPASSCGCQPVWCSWWR